MRDVGLVRHAYVATAVRGHGSGGRLLAHLVAHADRPLLVGSWAAATWAIRFYERHGFALVAHGEKERPPRCYWSIPERQIATSVVPADARWRARAAR